MSGRIHRVDVIIDSRSPLSEPVHIIIIPVFGTIPVSGRLHRRGDYCNSRSPPMKQILCILCVIFEGVILARFVDHQFHTHFRTM